ncbi:hypothetical protein NPIL_503161 [Nephila pilipes]|uniref:Uncharacterized protein n=1 Tax=Nephila pilipes TaxID=299642 RepID=A0A8X6TQS6_NEPPI|nr:hypothetical protein NPIL_503161 [Nephila pilipes]
MDLKHKETLSVFLKRTILKPPLQQTQDRLLNIGLLLLSDIMDIRTIILSSPFSEDKDGYKTELNTTCVFGKDDSQTASSTNSRKSLDSSIRCIFKEIFDIFWNYCANLTE